MAHRHQRACLACRAALHRLAPRRCSPPWTPAPRGGNTPNRKAPREVTIPILPVLDEILKAGPCADLAFICGENGAPVTKKSFGNVFRDACNAAGVTKSAHGVRKIGATRTANNGATVAELEAIFGWNGGRMASLYTRAADKARPAKGAMAKLDRTPGEQTIPHLLKRVRGAGAKR